MKPIEAIGLATDNILSQLKDLDMETQKQFKRRFETLFQAQSKLLHFRMELMDLLEKTEEEK
jgi:hypothetical protein